MSAIKEAMERKEGAVNLARLVGVDSLDRNLQAEDAEAKHYGEQFREMDGATGNPETDVDPMRILAAGPVTVYQNEPPKSELPSPVATMRKTIGPIAKAALAAALFGSGIGAGAAIPWALGMLNPPAAETPDTIGQIVLE